MYVNPGNIVKKGEEVFNVTVMKMEMAVPSPADGMVKRVLKFADYNMDKKMIPVKGGKLLVELGPIPRKCTACAVPLLGEDYKFCPSCGLKLKS
jgi:pyruvate carboxylase